MMANANILRVEQARPGPDLQVESADNSGLAGFNLEMKDFPAIVMALDGTGKVTDASNRLLEFTGYTSEDLIGRHVSDLITPASHEYLVDHVFDGYFRTGSFRDTTVTYVLKDGTMRSGMCSCRGEKDHKGRIIRTFVCVHDVTRERVAESALRQSEERFRGAFETAAHGMALMLPDGKLIAANQALCALTDTPEPELTRMSLQNLVKDSHRPELLNNIGRILAGEQASAQIELDYALESGAIVTGQTSISAVRGATGSIAHFVIQIVDLSGRRETDARMKQAQKMEAVGQLTGGIAHDFNNLLQVVIGNLQIVESDVTTDKARESANEAIEAALRGSELTRQLLAFSRRQSLAPEEILVNHMISGMTSMLKRSVGESIQFETKLMPQDAKVRADLSQLESALLNLAINSRDAMAKGGCLTVETNTTYLDEKFTAKHEDLAPGHYVTISVSDNGCGISDSVIDNVFEPFFTTKEEGQGSGLGLSMAYGFIKQSGGHIRILSERGKGTSVKMYLPRIDLADLDEESMEIEGDLGAPRKTVLVVEDQNDVRKVAVQFIKSFGYRVLEAEDGIIALGIIQEQEDIDLLFTDIVMPGGMNGFDLSRAASKLNPSLKVIHASGYPKGAMPVLQDIGVQDRMIMKPYRKEELQQALEEALEEAA